MKTRISKFLILLLVTSCTSSKEVQKLTQQIDSLKTEIVRLQSENEELRNGEERLVNLIDYSIKNSLIANINELGIWDIGDYVDDFGESTGKKFVQTYMKRHFRNTSTACSNAS